MGETEKRAKLVLNMVVISALVLFASSVHAMTYSPGQTLDPACGPTDPTCDVIQPYISSSTPSLSLIQNGLYLASSTPSSTVDTLYALGNSLYWNGTALGTTNILSGNLVGDILYWNGTQWEPSSIVSFSTSTNTFAVAGMVSSTALFVNGNATTSGNLSVSGITNLATTTASALTVSGNARLATSTIAALTVSNTSTLAAITGTGLSISGNTSLATTTVSGTLSFGAASGTSVTLAGGVAARSFSAASGGANNAYYSAADGENAGVAHAATGRLRYNALTNAWEVSASGTPYNAILTAAMISTDGTFASSSDALIPSQKAVKTYVGNFVNGLAWRPAVDLLDSVDTTQPTTTATQVDGVTVANNDRVLFTNLPSGNNEVYLATVSGSSITWTLQTDGQAGNGSPTNGDTIFVKSGTGNGGKTLTYAASSTWVLGGSLSGALLASNNLSDLNNVVTARENLGLGTSSSPTFTGLMLTGPLSVGGNIAAASATSAFATTTITTLTVSNTSTLAGITGTGLLINGHAILATTSIAGLLAVNGTASTTALIVNGNATTTGNLVVQGSSNLSTSTATGLTLSQNGLTLVAASPATTTNTLYNQGGSLYWNGSLVGVTTSTVDYGQADGYEIAQTVSSTSFTTIAGMTESAGNLGYSNNAFTLTAGKTYRIQYGVRGDFGGTTSTIAYTRLYDAANAVAVGDTQWLSARDDLSALAYNGTYSDIYTPSATATVELQLRVNNASSTFTVQDAYLQVEQVGSTASTGVTMNSLTGAIASGSLDSQNFAQTWNWSTATSTTAMTMTANALTTGSLLSLTSTSTALHSTNGLLYVANNGSSTSGAVARIQANPAAGSGLTVLANGSVAIGTTTADNSDGNASLLNIGSPAAAVPSKRLITALLPDMPTGSVAYIGLGADTSAKNSGWIAFDYAGASSTDNRLSFGLYGVDNVLSITGAGTVGIGTSTPATSTMLDVETATSTSGVALARFFQPNLPDSGYDGLQFGKTAASGQSGVLQYVLGTSGTSYGNSYIDLTNYGDANGLVIQKGGNVGIGTTSPQAPLEVDATTTGDGFVGAFLNPNGNIGSGQYFEVGHDLSSSSNAGELSFYYAGDGSSSNYLGLGFKGNGQKLDILPNGNVGIGTAAPGSKLTVMNNNETYSANVLLDTQSTGQQATISFDSAGTQKWQVGKDTNDSFMIYNTGVAAPALTIDSISNDVGIGTASPSTTLEIVGGGNGTGVGNIQLTLMNPNDAAGNYWRVGMEGPSTNGFVIADQGDTGVYLHPGDTSWSALSDARLKTDIQDMIATSTPSSSSSILQDVLALNPVYYNYTNATSSANRQIGFIAQQVLPYFPQLVTQPGDATSTCSFDNPGECYGLTYDRFGVVAIAGLQEFYSEYASTTANLASEITNLKSEIAAGANGNGTNVSLDTLNQLTVSGALTVFGHVALGADTVGEATVVAGSASTTVSFATPYAQKPIITLTPEGNASQLFYRVNDITPTGFHIVVTPAQSVDTVFAWHAFAEAGDAFTAPALTSGGSDATSTNDTISSATSTANATGTATLNVSLSVQGGTATPDQFAINAIAGDPSISSFPGNASGTTVTIDALAPFFINISTLPNYTPAYAAQGDCNDKDGLPAGTSATCAITEIYSAFATSGANTTSASSISSIDAPTMTTGAASPATASSTDGGILTETVANASTTATGTSTVSIATSTKSASATTTSNTSTTSSSAAETVSSMQTTAPLVTPSQGSQAPAADGSSSSTSDATSSQPSGN